MNEEVMRDDTMRPARTSDAAIVKTVRVPLAPDQAFELFTARMNEWWPLATHSAGEADAAAVALDGRIGGLIVETLRDGSTSVWGTITRWVPSHELAFTWHPARGPEEATEVSVVFDVVDGGTEVTLVHTGWANRQDGDLHARYVAGWEHVLGEFAASA